MYVVDSRNLSTGQGLLVLHGAELAAAGQTAEEIQKACTDLAPQVEASFVIDRLDYLYKGGRCSALSAFGGNLLKLKPCIEVKDGKMTPGKKYRGPIDKVMLQYADDRLRGRDDINKHRVFITHTRCAPEAVEAVRQKILALAPDFEVIIDATAGSTVATLTFTVKDPTALDKINVTVTETERNDQTVNNAETLTADLHTETETVNAKAATRTDEGYTGDVVCKACG